MRSSRFFDTGSAKVANWRRSFVIGRAAISAGVPTSAASPSDLIAGIDACRERAELLDEAVEPRRRLAEVG